VRTVTPDLRDQVLRLEGCYGSPEPPAVTDPFRAVAEAVAPQLPEDFSWLLRAHQLLRRHGQVQAQRSSLRGLPADGRLSLVPGADRLKSGMATRGGLSSARRFEMQIQRTLEYDLRRSCRGEGPHRPSRKLRIAP
jgi:hypothetical protein